MTQHEKLQKNVEDLLRKGCVSNQEFNTHALLSMASSLCIIVDELKTITNKKIGHWDEHCTKIVCSECGIELDDDIINMSDKMSYPRFCPCCGTPMEKKT